MSVFHSLADTDAARSLRDAGKLTWNWLRRDWLGAAALVGSLLLIAYFYGVTEQFGKGHSQSAFSWMVSTWNPKTGYDHGFIVPVLMLVLIARRLPAVAEQPPRPSYLGLAVLIFGVLTYVAAVRSYQPRVAIGGLPFLILGAVGWVHGLRAARLLAFPVLLLYFVIYLPQLQQATNGLQLLATKSAYHLTKLAGIPVSLSGNEINSVPPDRWGFNIAAGCSGIRSLMALTLIAAVYAHLTQKVFWKKVVLFACSVPLAIIGNCLRVSSILIVAEYFNPKFAAESYHDGSGFIFFAVVGLAGLCFVDWLINRNRRERVVTRRITASATPASSPSL